MGFTERDRSTSESWETLRCLRALSHLYLERLRAIIIGYLRKKQVSLCTHPRISCVEFLLVTVGDIMFVCDASLRGISLVRDAHGENRNVDNSSHALSCVRTGLQKMEVQRDRDDLELLSFLSDVIDEEGENISRQGCPWGKQECRKFQSCPQLRKDWIAKDGSSKRPR
jgi:hypothetical protein